MSIEKLIIEPCPKCKTPANGLAIYGYPIENPYLLYGYCPKCGFSTPAADGWKEAIIKWNETIAGIRDRQQTVIKNRDELIKRGII